MVAGAQDNCSATSPTGLCRKRSDECNSSEHTRLLDPVVAPLLHCRKQTWLMVHCSSDKPAIVQKALHMNMHACCAVAECL